MQKKDWRSAAISFRVAAQNLPRDAEPQYQLALVYLSGGAGVKAIEALQKAVHLNPRHQAANRQLAILHAASGDSSSVKEGRATLRVVISDSPEDGEALAALAVAEAKLGDAAEARRHLGESLKIRPEALPLASQIVSHYAANGRLDQAVSVVRDVQLRLPGSADVAFLAAQVAAAAKNPEEAERQLQKALRLKPGFAPALELLLRKRVAERDQAGAAQVARLMTALPERRWWSLYGKLLFAEHKVAQGIAEFDRLLREHPDDQTLRGDYSALLAASGRHKEAQALVEKSLKQTSGDPASLLQRAAFALDRGDADAAEADLFRLDQKGLNSPAIIFQQARLHGLKGQTSKMGQALSEALRLNPELLPARLELARILTSAGRPQTALTVIDAASARQKRLPEMQFHRISILMASGDWKAAKEAIQGAKQVHGLPGFSYQEALVCWHDNDAVGAERALGVALRKAPADPAALWLLGDVLRAQGKQSAYITALQTAASQVPQSGDVLLLLAEEWARQGDRHRAREVYTMAERLGAGEAAIGALALLDISEGDWTAARERLENRVKKVESVRLRILLGSLEGRPGGNPEGAITHYTAVLRLSPADFAATNNLAELLSRIGKLDQAQFWADKALRLSPDHPAARDTVGWVRYLRGDYQAALPHLERSLELQDRPLARYHLAAALARTGKFDRGRREFETAIRMAPTAPERAQLSTLFER